MVAATTWCDACSREPAIRSTSSGLAPGDVSIATSRAPPSRNCASRILAAVGERDQCGVDLGAEGHNRGALHGEVCPIGHDRELWVERDRAVPDDRREVGDERALSPDRDEGDGAARIGAESNLFEELQ